MGNMMPCLNKDKLQESTQFGGVSYLNINIPVPWILWGLGASRMMISTTTLTLSLDVRTCGRTIIISPTRISTRRGERGPSGGWDPKHMDSYGNPFKTITRWWQLKHLLFSPRNLGKIPNLTNIFQMGWNHQPDYLWNPQKLMGKMQVLSFKPPKIWGWEALRMKETWVPMVVTFLQATFDPQGVLLRRIALQKLGGLRTIYSQSIPIPSMYGTVYVNLVEFLWDQCR